MQKRRKWLAYTAVITGIVVAGLLALAINRGPLVEGFQPYQGEHSLESYFLWSGEEELSFQNILGMVCISLLIFVVPAGHIAVLIMLAVQLRRPAEPPEPQPVHQCLHCEHQLRRNWNICPYCGERIAGAQDQNNSGEKAHVDQAQVLDHRPAIAHQRAWREASRQVPGSGCLLA